MASYTEEIGSDSQVVTVAHLWLRWVKLSHSKVSHEMQDDIALLQREHAPKQWVLASCQRSKPQTWIHLGQRTSWVQQWQSSSSYHFQHGNPAKKNNWGGVLWIQVCHPLHLSPCVNILMQKETDSSLSGKVRFPLPNIYQNLGHMRSG